MKVLLFVDDVLNIRHLGPRVFVEPSDSVVPQEMEAVRGFFERKDRRVAPSQKIRLSLSGPTAARRSLPASCHPTVS